MTYKFLSLFIIYLFLFSCDNENINEVPTYIKIDSIVLDENTSQNIVMFGFTLMIFFRVFTNCQLSSLLVEGNQNYVSKQELGKWYISNKNSFILHLYY